MVKKDEMNNVKNKYYGGQMDCFHRITATHDLMCAIHCDGALAVRPLLLSHVHTHARTHTRARVRTHTHTDTHTCVHTYKFTNTPVNVALTLLLTWLLRIG